MAIAVGLTIVLQASAGERPYIGLSGLPVSKGQAVKMGISEGMRVTTLPRGCPGAAVLELGDVLYRIDSHPVGSLQDLVVVLARAYAPGQPVTLHILREGAPLEVQLTLARPGCVSAGEVAPAADAPVVLPYASPFLADGTLATWGEPSEAARLVGDLAGQAAGTLARKATSQAASQVPMVGGLLSSAAGKVATEVTANTLERTIGSKLQADFRFATPCDLGRHLTEHRARPDFATALDAVGKVYPAQRDAIVACVGSTAPAVSGATPPPNPGGAGPGSMVSQLEALKALYDQGALTEEEYTAAKARVLKGQ